MKIDYIKVNQSDVIAAIQTSEIKTLVLEGKRLHTTLDITKNNLLDTDYNRLGEYFELITSFYDERITQGTQHRIKFSRDEMIDLKDKIEELLLYQPER